MKLRRIRQYLTMMAVFILLFSSLSYPQIGHAITGGEETNEVSSYFKTIENIPVYISVNDEPLMLGKVSGGTSFPVERVEGDKVYFLLHSDVEAFVYQGGIQWEEELIENEELLLSNFESSSELFVEKGTQIVNNKDDLLLTLETEFILPILSETEDYYVTQVGPFAGKITVAEVEAEEVSEEVISDESEVITDETTDSTSPSNEEQELVDESGAGEVAEEVETPETPEVQVTVEPVSQTVQAQAFTSSTKYFEVIKDNIPVYDNSTGSLVEVGWLKKGEVYPRVRDYGSNWHEIRFGDGMAYVRKVDTAPANGTTVKNENQNYQNTSRSFVPKADIEVYDNSSGQLVSYATLKDGRAYPIVGEFGSNWYRVLVSDRVGYVRSAEVDVQPAQAKPLAFTSATKYFEVVNENVPVYDNSTGSLVEVGWLQQGEVYPRVRDFGPNWHEIRYGNDFAYVRKADTRPSNGSVLRNENKNFENTTRSFIPQSDIEVYDNTSGQLVPFGVIKQGRSYPIVGNFGANWYRVLLSDRVGFVRTSEVELAFRASDQYFRVTTDHVEVYDNSSGRLVKVGELVNGQVYPRVRDFGNWHEIEFGKIKGYVRKAGTQPATNSGLRNENRTFKNGRFILEAKQTIEVYDNSSGSLVPFAKIEQGQKYPVVGTYGANWYRILVANRVGFVRSAEIDITANFIASDKYFQVVNDGTIIYDNSTGSLVAVGELEKGQVYPRIRDFGANWHQIQYGNSFGYVRKSDTVPTTNSGLRNENKSLKNSGGRIKANQDIQVFDNSSGRLVPFATIFEGGNYPIVGNFGANWYQIIVSGRIGFVRSAEVELVQQPIRHVVNGRSIYTYSQMTKDLQTLQEMYPDIMETRVIGKSIDGRNIYAIKLGTGRKEIMINGSNHAREHMTTNVVMKMLDTYAYAYKKGQRIDGFDVKRILDQTSIWFIPMLNPDGVSLVQLGANSAKDPAAVIRLNGGSANFNAWKANIRGVDLNRQFPALWNTITNDPGRPSPFNYKGPRPLSEPESKAIYDFTLSRNFLTAVSYHSSGEVIFSRHNYESRSRVVTNLVANKTGYAPINLTNNSGGGFTDWFIISQRRAGITPEISPFVGPRPVPLSNWNRIWEQNFSVGIMLADEASRH
ncbi:M14 family zinc carboxypeptidase [Alkalihalobacterium sp. APHAB7]|uniref:M14 family zinc carboxypeptidase n=1 Tax=Alkalihalobacterium sp. APHAB7 TaxID=3402081 RepID=UPI003AAE2BA3